MGKERPGEGEKTLWMKINQGVGHLQIGGGTRSRREAGSQMSMLRRWDRSTKASPKLV